MNYTARVRQNNCPNVLVCCITDACEFSSRTIIRLSEKAYSNSWRPILNLTNRF
jgi:hypothetical protein